jgi:hypothetical protein
MCNTRYSAGTRRTSDKVLVAIAGEEFATLDRDGWDSRSECGECNTARKSKRRKHLVRSNTFFFGRKQAKPRRKKLEADDKVFFKRSIAAVVVGYQRTNETIMDRERVTATEEKN